MKKNAFTLAEVLITLAVIGIVSAIALPSLMSSYKYKQLGTRCAKFHSQLQNALQAEAGGGEGLEGTADIENILRGMYVTKTGAMWAPPTTSKDADGNSTTSEPDILQDGTSITVDAAQTYTGVTIASNLGSAIASVTLRTNVTGLKENADNTFTFNVTSLGFLIPANECTHAVVQLDYVTNESNGTYGGANPITTTDTDGACVTKATESDAQAGS